MTHRASTSGWTAVVLTAAALAGFAPAYAADAMEVDDPRELLTEMSRAFSDLSYDGVFVYNSGRDLATLRVVHMVVAGEQRERLVHLNGAPREIVRHGEEVACILMPGDKLLELEGSIPSGPFARAFVRRYDRISEFYGLSLNGEDRVAGRSAMRLAVAPRDDDRFGYRIWLDKETRLLLRSELIDADGQRLEIFQFVQLALGADVNPSALEPENRDGSLVNHLTLATTPSEPVQSPDVQWYAGWLPAGFNMAASEIRRTPSSLKSVNTMMYTDGLAAFSVFIEDMPPAGAASMTSRTGATVAVTHLVEGPGQQRHLIHVVGELPTATARRIARSIAYSEKS